MTDLERVVQYVNAAAFAVLGVLAVLRWRSDRSDPAQRLAVAFGLLGAVAAVGLAVPAEPRGVVALAAQRLLLLGIVLYVWALVRFIDTFDALWTRASRVFAALTLLVAGTGLVLPSLPGEGEPRPWWFQTWVLAFLVQWLGGHVLVASRLWTAGRELPSVSRRRARLLAVGALLLGVVLLPAASTDEVPGVAAVVLTLLPSMAATVLYLGFAPPAWLKTQWRQPEMGSLREATEALMSLREVDEIADRLLPPAAQVLGGSGARLRDHDGTVIAEFGSGTPGLPVAEVSVPVGRRWLEVSTGPYTPFFGREERELLAGLGAFIDIAIDRAESARREVEARQQLEAAAAEMETLVYGLSHDLKSPIISLLGYLDYLEEDYADRLDDEGRFFVERMRSSAVYMQELINDLLELSRVGRVETETTDVDLAAEVAGVADRLAPSYPAGRVRASGPLPILRANLVRVQQLVSNIVENALKHGGRPDISVTVSAADAEDVVEVFFDDDGQGIPLPHRETVFGIFERLEAAPETARGTGIGLAMCRRIARSMDGSLDVVDGGPGVGARFRLRLPGDVVVQRPHPVSKVIGG